jgi:membrane-associated phospholipid phosphatase
MATLGFSVLAGDLVLWHNFWWLDTGLHLSIKDQVSLELHDFARHAMSNTPIVLGWCGWAAAAVALVLNTNNNNTTSHGAAASTSTALRHFLLSVTMYCIGGGTIMHGDPWLVKLTKDVFHRARPTELSHTYAFPSGHTTSASFVIGALLFIILPAVLNSVGQQSSTRTKEEEVSDNKFSTISRKALQIVQENRIMIWIFGTAVTASGRVLADVHWSTDVMAGACLGTGLVALTALACGISDALVENEK